MQVSHHFITAAFLGEYVPFTCLHLQTKIFVLSSLKSSSRLVKQDRKHNGNFSNCITHSLLDLVLEFDRTNPHNINAMKNCKCWAIITSLNMIKTMSLMLNFEH